LFIKQANQYSTSSVKMSRQTFLFSPKFNKKLIYNSPSNKYQEFTNAYVYSIMFKTGNDTPNRNNVCRETTKEWNKIKNKSKSEIDEIIRDYLAMPNNLYDIQKIRLSDPLERL
ncbi:9849_t:CDS:2, partial [Funneliformis geosporum]